MDKVQINKSGGVCRLTHAAPKRRNALNTKMTRALRYCLAEIAAMKACKVRCREGVEPYFCTGIDLEFLPDANAESDRTRADELLARGVICKTVHNGQANAATRELAEGLEGFPGDGLVSTKMAPRRSVARMEPAEWFGPAETVDPLRALTPRKVSSCRVSTDAQRLKPGKKGYYHVHTRQHR
jgi:enoyl-CoA hydratase/carnithine racemase